MIKPYEKWFSYVLVHGIRCSNYFTDFRLLQEGKKLKTLQPSFLVRVTLYKRDSFEQSFAGSP